MSSALIQLKVDPRFKKEIQWLASYKGIPVSAYIKLVLTENLRIEKKTIYTINGLTEDEETDILKREKELINLHKKALIKPLTAKNFLKELND